jgi:hypothetical protein
MKAFVARGAALTHSGHKHKRSFKFYNNLGRFNFKITTQKSGRWNKPVIVITVVTV